MSERPAAVPAVEERAGAERPGPQGRERESMSEWTDRDARQADARAEYEKIMTTPGPDPTGAYIDVGVIGFVFGEMWRRGVLTPRDRRFITLSCVAACDADDSDRDPLVGGDQQR